jgi:hypothetical protein
MIFAGRPVFGLILSDIPGVRIVAHHAIVVGDQRFVQETLRR